MAKLKRSSFAYLAPTFVGLVCFGLVIAFPILAPSSFDQILPEKKANTSPEISKNGENNEMVLIMENKASEEAEKSTASAKLIFTGDIMLARDVERTIKNRGTNWPFLQLSPSLTHFADIIIGNLETTIRSEELLEEENVLNFDTIPSNLEILKEAGFTHLSLANNHTDDFGSTVTTTTRNAVTNNEMIPFGDPAKSPEYIERLEIDGVNISLIGFHAFNEYVIDLEDAIKQEKEADQFVIVYPHWGTEYVNEPSIYQREAAQRFVDAGADLIIGAHPHVIQQFELIDDIPVVYSLGNFLFDQDFSEEVKTGLVAAVEITNSDIIIEFLPIRIIYRQVLFDETWNDEAQEALNLSELVIIAPRKAVQTP